ncbi:hypothetical protein P170DRAFT_461608 [Aspergillus steynii IBT 23096]|uniref:Heterokaryon incompatibility domain-containing protein n=1 Tax=Aspergillus steynii IBT 23096 TaxID=1392250 RepID=A0A2I2GSJ8_9EURO|nr:uncharacterized protein P170DRAFT_461608 [Aspergillus steynii IBT 23096]PLB55846.1 hypothetical protein P170DRAFT_461608 [Aspergillus steynii IBT 23096]
MGSPLDWDEIGAIPYRARGNLTYNHLSFRALSQEWREKVYPWHSIKDGNPTISAQGVKYVSAFLQAWLFFGLLREVVGEDNWDRASLIHDNGTEINKSMVVNLVNQWKKRELASEVGRAGRLVRIQLVLSEARTHVLQICSVEDEKSDSSLEDAEYNTIALSLMVLGEMLSNLTARILEDSGQRKALGWTVDENRGWGQTGAILRSMQRKWSPETVHMLRSSLRGHATAQLYALRISGEEEKGDNEGQVIKNQGSVSYEMAHWEGCEHREDGKNEDLVGPDEKQLGEIIQKGKIPLVKYTSATNKVELVEYDVGTRYAILSHVWSDGYGNPSENKTRPCLLAFYNELFFKAQKILHRIDPDPELPFWMDTLTIPVRDPTQRKQAIKTMHRSYTHADFTIVLDSRLGQMQVGHSYAETAMKIFSSRWMSRLWTLQEAYLSKKLIFKFQDTELVDLDLLEGNYLSHPTLAESMVAAKARKYYDRLLGWQRQKRIYNVRIQDDSLLPSIWEAVQWRTTSHPKHETQALATLFQLEVDFPDGFDHFQCGEDCGKGIHKPCADDLDHRMKLLLESLYDAYPGSIPQGMIFLPGRRLSIEGFGWAPSTWMVGHEVNHDDPIFNTSQAAELTFNGLLVRYPGFLLHSSENRMYLENENSFVFSRDILLLEWYAVRPVEGSCSAIPRTKGSEFAIISSRDTIFEDREIALLVEIKRRRHPKLHVEILSRVWIWRERDQSRIHEFQKRFWDQKADACEYGESLNPDQLWSIGRCSWQPKEGG